MSDINLVDILTDDQSVRTKILNHPDWIVNRIIKVDSDAIHIEFKPEYLKLLLTIGDSINIKLEHSGVEYTIASFVENVIFSAPPKVILKVENIISHHDIRSFIRWNINLLCKIVPTSDEFKIQGITTDISEGGIAMVSYADFNVQDTVLVEIITQQNEVLSFRGNIKRLEAKLNNHIQYGIEILEIDDFNKSILNGIISNLNNKI